MFPGVNLNFKREDIFSRIKMALKTLVKISEVNNLSDARYCAGMGVEMIGFSLDENHPKFIDLASIREIAVWICGVKVVGEFTGSNIYNMNYLAEQLNLDYIQLDHPLHPEFYAGIKYPVIQKLLFDPKEKDRLSAELENYKDKVAYFLLENENADLIYGNEEILKEWCKEYPIILGFGIKNEALDKILQEIKPAGIALKGGEEIKPGLKNFDELAEILEKLEEE